LGSYVLNYLADRQTHRQTESPTDAAKRFTPATIVCVSK